MRNLHLSAGISDAEIEAAERAQDAERLPTGTDYWHRQILETRATEDLDACAESGLENLRRRVDPKWLRDQAQNPYRLGPSFLSSPLHVVSSVRVGTNLELAGPQRFARMLLLCQDHIRKESNLDFFSAATFVPEIAMLGNSLKEIDALGPEAARKLARLPSMSDEMVTASIFELLVGAACIRRGMNVEMVKENLTHKVPDYRVDGLGIPASIECKRRLGLTKYELDEAHRVEALYTTIRGPLRDRGHHASIEVCFRMPVALIQPQEFLHEVLAAAKHGQDYETTQSSWGSLAVRRLPFWGDISGTRLYSPDFLQTAFDWNQDQSEWDGLLCEVEAPPSIAVQKFRLPICLKWRSESDEALLKKARGVTSLWADAVRQIPDGEIGFVYIAYPEGARPAIADVRTRYILDYMAKKAWHRWSVRVPATVITRLYSRTVGAGCPDLTENSMPGADKGEEFWLARLPWRIFTL
jgi:hypothetical protein